jgi:hypothetical protein
MAPYSKTYQASAPSVNVDGNQEIRQVGSAHVLQSAVTPGSRHFAGSEPLTSAESRVAELPDLHQRRTSTTRDQNSASRFSVEGVFGENASSNNRGLPTPALTLDHQLAFQTATRASDLEMTTIESAQRSRRAAYNLPRTSQLRQSSRQPRQILKPRPVNREPDFGSSNEPQNVASITSNWSGFTALSLRSSSARQVSIPSGGFYSSVNRI